MSAFKEGVVTFRIFGIGIAFQDERVVGHLFEANTYPTHRRVTRHVRLVRSAFITKVAFSISREAPAFDRSRTTQSIVDSSSTFGGVEFLLTQGWPLIRSSDAASSLGTIKKSSSFWPVCIAFVSHRGLAPRPHQVLPSGARYFGDGFSRVALAPFPVTLLAVTLLPPVSRSSSFRNCSARLFSSAAISSRNLQRASFDRLSNSGLFGDINSPSN